MTQTSAFSNEENDDLDYTIGVRKKIITELVNSEDGKFTIPVSSADKALLMKALDGVDRTVLARSKIKIDQNNSKTSEEQTKLIGEFLTKLSPKAFLASQNESRTEEIPSLPADIELDNPVEGETEQGVKTFTYSEFFEEEEN